MSSPLFCGFDIETMPVPAHVTKYAKPYADFDESAVKYGNTKDPAKRATLLAEKRQEHEDGRVPYWTGLMERAALDPFTGAIVCIGVVTELGEPAIYCEATEAGTLREFWLFFNAIEHAMAKFVFWSGCGDVSRKFDIDFIVTRSRILGVPVPGRVSSGRYYSAHVVDLAGEFLLHQRDRYLSLTKAADMLGLYAEHEELFPKSDSDPVTGANFWQWWSGCAQPPTEFTQTQQREHAERYLVNDLLHLKYLAPRILS